MVITNIKRIFAEKNDNNSQIYLKQKDICSKGCINETFRVLKDNEIRQYGEYAPSASFSKHGINLNTTTDMRSFSDTEKRVLRFMAYPPMPQDVCIISLFENYSDCYLIGWPEDCSSLKLVHSQDKDWKDVRAKIFDIIVLLQY